MSRSLRRFVLSTAITVVTLTLLAACTVTVNDGSSSGTDSPTVPTPETQSQTGPVARVALEDIDLPGFFRVALRDGGDQVEGEVTLDGCGYRFSTEGHRIARRQIDLVLNGIDTGVSNEVVQYDTEEAAAEAMAEIKESVEDCTLNRYVKSPVEDQPEFKYTRVDVARYTGSPIEDNWLQTAVYSIKGGGDTTFHGMYLFMRQDDILDGFYINAPQAFSEADLSLFYQLAAICAKKLQAETTVV